MIKRYTPPTIGALWTDEATFKRMLAVELAVCEALSKQGLISPRDLATIKRKAHFNIDDIRRREKTTKHDVVAFVNDVASRVGPAGRFIHFGVTSSDVLDTANAMGLKAAGLIIKSDLKKLLTALRRQAKKYKDTPCMGRTHGVHAEPTTFGMKLALFYDEFNRNLARLNAAIETVSVGKISGAVGTFSCLPPSVERAVCKKLGLKADKISTQIVQRDRHAHFLTTLAIIGASLEKMATEIRGLQKTEVREVEEPFTTGQRGSSAMPHKRNPVRCERMTGMARLLRTNALAALENVALWHERDISHSSVERVIVPDSTIIVDFLLIEAADIIKNMHVYPLAMMRNINLTKGLVFSQKVLLELIKKGLTRDEAYKLVQANAMKTWATDKDFKTLLLEDKAIGKLLSASQIKRCFNLKHNLRYVDTILKRVGIL